MKRVAQIERSYMRDDIPHFGSGDTLRVHVKIKEGDKERIQVFQGTVIASRGKGIGATFTIRKISNGIGVERVFPFHSPNIAKIERLKGGSVRRKKLYYLRDLTGKSARIKEKIIDPKDANKLHTRSLVASEVAPEPVVEETVVVEEAVVETAAAEETAVETKAAEKAPAKKAPAKKAAAKKTDDKKKKE